MCSRPSSTPKQISFSLSATSSRHLAITANMHFLTALLTTLFLASSHTLALILPDNYTIIEIIPIEPKYMYKEAKGNPHVPLINATLRCGREYTPLYEIYTLTGENWDGVTEEQLKNAAKQGGLMTDWYYFSWKEDECILRESLIDCSKRPAGWKASVSFPKDYPRLTTGSFVLVYDSENHWQDY
jgi:hypothetical protein